MSERISQSTLHSLALTILRKTGNLKLYPADPTIMDDWELASIFDGELSVKNKLTPTRCAEIRRDHEAYWSTGKWNSASTAIKNPITDKERELFQSYEVARTQLYFCVLPGEVIRLCVNQIRTGLIDPVQVLGVQHMIVDEVQDLNPCDFEFIDLLIAKGVNVFISGDDDQSVYAFRYAFPEGIQKFNQNYPKSSDHVLEDCFRCTTNILNAAVSVIKNFPAADRIPKNLISVYSGSDPINDGIFLANMFRNAADEAKYIAKSCSELINAGVSL